MGRLNRIFPMRLALGLALLLPFLAGAPAGAAETLGREDCRGLLRAARRLADAIDAGAGSPAVGLIGRIAEEQYRAGDAEGARDGARVVREEFERRGDCGYYSSMEGLARAQRETGNILEASATLKVVLDVGRGLPKNDRERCLGPLAVLRAEEGDPSGAKALAAEIPGIRKTDVLPKIAVILARQGRLDEAVALADSVNPTWGNSAVWEVLSVQMEGPRWKEAVATNERLGFDSADRLLESAAVQAALGGDFARAENLATRVKKREDALFAWSRIAAARARHGDVSGGFKTARARLDGHPYRLAAALMEIAEIQRRAGDVDGAGKTRDAAVQACAKCDAEVRIRHQLPALAREARKEEFLALAKGLPPGRDWTLAETVKELAEAGDVEAAAWVAGLMDADGGNRENVEKAFGALAHAQARRGDAAGALRSMEAMGRAAVGQREELLRLMAVEQARRGDLRGALRTAEELDDDLGARPLVLEAIAQAEIEAQDWPRAPAWIGGLADPEEKARVWLGAARGLRLRNERQRPK